MRPLIAMLSGSRAYGTATPESDTDLKLVHIPAPADIVMQRAKAAERVPVEDGETFALHKFLEMCAEGQPLAIEMLSAPDTLWTAEPSPEWLEILANRDRLLVSKTAFARYAEGQAGRFGDKSARIEALRRVLAVLDAAIARHGPEARLETVKADLAAVAASVPGIAFPERPIPGGRTLAHLATSERQTPMTSSLALARDVFASALAKYGKKARAAEAEGGVNWKAVMHGLRLAEEGLEYLATGTVELPRPNAEFLRAVRLGRVPLERVEQAIGDALARYPAAEAACRLPEAADRAWMDALVLRTYWTEVSTAPRPQPAPPAPEAAPRPR